MHGLIAIGFIALTICFVAFDTIMTDREKRPRWEVSKTTRKAKPIIEAKFTPVATEIVPEVGSGSNLPAIITPTEEEWPNLYVGYEVKEVSNGSDD